MYCLLKNLNKNKNHEHCDYLLVELGSGVVISHAVLVGVHGGLVGVDRGGTVGRGGDVLAHGGGDKEGEHDGGLE